MYPRPIPHSPTADDAPAARRLEVVARTPLEGPGAARRRPSPIDDTSALVIESDVPVIVLPSYAPQSPDAVALLALWLAGEDRRVLVHGRGLDGAVGTAAVLADLGIVTSSTAGDVAAAWRRRQPAFVDLARLAPSLGQAPVTSGRGLETASLHDPVAGARSLRVVGAPDRASAISLGEAARQRGLDLMVVGTPASSAAAWLRHQPRIDTWIDGIWRVELSLVERPLSHLEMPLLPPITDAAANAVWVQSVLSGERPLPLPLEMLLERIAAAVQMLEVPQRGP